VRRPEEKRSLGRSRRRWVDNIKIELRERTGRTGLIWLTIGTSGGLFVNTVMNLRVP
jgi:hypothetical protein